MVLTSVLTLLGVGLALAVLLAVAARLLSVAEDPRIEEVLEALPGANCGGCGFAGCEAYASSVIRMPDVAANLCTVGGTEVAAKVAELAGKDVLVSEPMICFRRCSREEGNVQKRYDYVGANTCASVALLEGGSYMCSWACLGYGDCLRACPFDAMYVQDNMVEIIRSKCVSCGMCIKACPRSILQLIPQRARVMTYCATREKLKSVSDVCDVGCVNCLKCLKACPADAIRYDKRRIEIDHGLCLAYGEACGEACVAACSRGIFRIYTPTVAIGPMEHIAAEEETASSAPVAESIAVASVAAAATASAGEDVEQPLPTAMD